MVAYLSKSDATEGFNQIINFLNGSSLKYALTVNPHIYVSCIKQFWITVDVKQVNDVTRLQAIVDKKKVVVIEATTREALRLDDAEGVDCLPNEEIFIELARMGYEKPSTKLTRVGKGFSGVEIPLFEGILVEQQGDEEGDAYEHVKEVNAGDAAHGDDSSAHGEVPTVTKEPSIPSPTPPNPPPQPPQDLPSTSQDESAQDQRRQAESQAKIYKIHMDHANKVLSMQEDKIKLAEVQEVVDVVTTAKLITEVVTAASETVTATSAIITTAEAQVPAATLTVAPARVAAATSKRRKGVVIMDHESESTTSTIIPAKTRSKDKGKGIFVEEPKPLKKKQ
nr:xylulose kinase-1 [Tanacetum cinerariifolium]